MNKIIYLLCFLAIISFPACTKSDSSNATTASGVTNILFIGDSFTFYNNGLDYHVQNLLNADGSGSNYHIDMVARASYTLQDHYSFDSTINKINSLVWDKVVLQEQSTRPITDESLFLEYAEKFDTLIMQKSKGVVLYMTWAYEDSASMLPPLESAYLSVGKTIGAEVAPVGEVWAYSLAKNPTIPMFIADGKHPLLAGTYLNACVFYIVLFNKNPVGNTYIPTGLDAATAKTLQQTAWDFMLTWNP